jgi:hypothetical protein
MNTTLTALLYLAASVAFIMALRGLSSPETARAGNFWGIAGMAIAIVTTLAQPNMNVSFWMLLAMAIGGGARLLHRGTHRDDGAAAAGRGLPLAGRPRGRAGGGGGVLLAGQFRHRRARCHQARLADRDGPGDCDRRDHLHRLGRRLLQAAGPALAAAQPDADAAPDQRRARRDLRAPADLVLRHGQRGGAVAADPRHAADGLVPDHPDRRRRHAGRRVDAQLLLGLGGLRHRLHACRTRR